MAGRNNYYQKNYEDSADALNIYLKKKPANSYAHELIGDAYFMLGKKELSLFHYLEAKKLDSENSRINKKLIDLE